MRPLKHTGDSANIAYYRERVAERERFREGVVWADVCCNAIRGRKGGGIEVLKVPTYSGTVYRVGEGAVASFRYEPKTRPRSTTLSERTVTRLVREALNPRRAAS